jgi:hypothetical protein
MAFGSIEGYYPLSKLEMSLDIFHERERTCSSEVQIGYACPIKATLLTYNEQCISPPYIGMRAAKEKRKEEESEILL